MRAQAPVEKKNYARARFHRSVRFRNRPVRNLTLTPSTTVKTIEDTSLIVLWPSKIHWSGSSASKVGSIVSLFFSITGLTPRMKLRPEHPTTSTNSRSF